LKEALMTQKKLKNTKLFFMHRILTMIFRLNLNS
jgi:hypothetical protein